MENKIYIILIVGIIVCGFILIVSLNIKSQTEEMIEENELEIEKITKIINDGTNKTEAEKMVEAINEASKSEAEKMIEAINEEAKEELLNGLKRDN